MKVFMVFVALIMVFSCLSVQSNDMAGYRQLNINLKALSEEAAAGAGLMTGSQSYSENGINASDAQRYAEFLTKNANECIPIFKSGSLRATCLVSGPAVSVTISYTPNRKIFHLFRDPEYPISQTSIYEWCEQSLEEE